MATDDEREVAQRVLRISDIVREPNRLLMPILGYDQMPLVSLEEAVTPLLPLLPEVQHYACVAKQRCKIPADGLTSDEQASIMLYSMGWEPLEQCLYVVLNNTLRSEDRRKLKPWFLYLKLILTALSRLPSEHKCIYRGVQLDLSHLYRHGERFTWWGFSSCTGSIHELQSELCLSKMEKGTIFIIESECGKDISRYTTFPSKEEILLPPGCQFEVVHSFRVNNGLHMIQLKKAQPPESRMMMFHPSSNRDNFDVVPMLTASPSRKTPEDQNKSDTIEQQTTEAILIANKTIVNEPVQHIP